MVQPSAKISGGIGADGPYWSGLAEGRFTLCRCASCGAWMWPAHHRCGKCGSWEQAWAEVAPEGRVYSWTRTWYGFDRTRERADGLPYVVILAEIPAADGARVLGVLEGDEDGLRIGAPVTGRILPPSPKSKGYPSIVWVLQRG